MNNVAAIRQNAAVLHRRSVFAGLAAFVAAARASPGRADTAAEPGPAHVIERFGVVLIAEMKAGRQTPFRQRFDMLAPAVDNTFDLTTILRNSVGLSWNNLPSDQRNNLLGTFRRYTIASWVANFDTWSGEQFQVLSDLRRSGNDIIVPTRIASPQGSPTDISYVMQQGAAGWKAVDVLADGSISRVAVQRSDFRSLLASGGVHALETSLQRKISTLSNGSLA